MHMSKAPSFGRNIQVLSRLTERRRSSPGDASKSGDGILNGLVTSVTFLEVSPIKVRSDNNDRCPYKDYS